MTLATRISKALPSLLILVLIGAGAYFYVHPALIPRQVSHLVHAAPCDAPIVYTVGSIDPHFGLSAADFAADIQTAAAVWNAAAGKEVLRYSSTTVSGSMPVNLVFDEREATLLLGKSIDTAQSMTTAQRAQIQVMEDAIAAQKTAYNALQTEFTVKVGAYQQEVDYWNANGGATKDEYAKLEAERAELKTEQHSINEQAAQINNANDQLKAKVAAFNAEIQTTNKQVQTFDANAGDFEQGVYQRDASGARITIYAYKNTSELIRTLEHEFGHSLGLEHNSNAQSIMYAYIEDLTTGPSADDMAALKQQCGI